MYCSKCGTEIQPGAKFCPKCGTPAPRTGDSAAANPSGMAATDTSSSRGPTQPNVPVLVGVVVAAAVVVVGIGIWVWFAFLAPYKIDEGTFPDPAIRTVVSSSVDTDGNGEISREEAGNVSEFTVDGAANIGGLEHFPNVRSITVKGSALGSADLASFPSLENFSAPDSALAAIDVSRNPNLTTLDIPDGTTVSGLDATQLQETWLPVSSKRLSGNDESNLEEKTGDSIERDVHGNPLVYTDLDYARNGSYLSTSTIEYAYDDAGRIATSTSETKYSGSTNTSTTTSAYGYDDVGRLTSITIDSPYNESKIEYAYDSDGKILTSTRSSSDSSSGPTITQVNYDNAGQAISITNEGEYPSENPMQKYSYDEDGRLSNCQTIEAKSYVYTNHELTYDEQGRVVQVDMTPGEFFSSQRPEYTPADYHTTVTYAYDENGKLVGGNAVEDYSDFASKRTATCEHDEHGNLVRVTVVVEPTSGSSSEYQWVYELSYERFFTLKDSPIAQPLLTVDPAFDGSIFELYSTEPDIPPMPNLGTEFTAFEYNIYTQF